MVKNTKGGKGAKSIARKSTTSGDSSFPIPTSDMEHFAVVYKMFGPACEVILVDGTKLLCHIRNKFKGRRKSSNLISVGSILLIGFREWEPDTLRKNCDLLFVYDSIQTSSLADRFTLPLLPNTSSTFSNSHDFLFDYTNYNTPSSTFHNDYDNHNQNDNDNDNNHFHTNYNHDFDDL